MENEEGRFSSDDTHMHRDSLPPLLELADEIQLRCESWRWRSTRLRAGIYFTLLTVLTITIIAQAQPTCALLLVVSLSRQCARLGA